MPVLLRNAVACAALVLGLAACGDDDAASKKVAQKDAATKAQPPLPVGVVTVKSGPVPLAVELPGRIEAFRVAQVRARVPGIVQKRLFEEGTDVKADQPLFQIDPSSLQAQLNNAAAAVTKAQAALNSARAREERFAPLVKTQAISEQEFADLVTARRAAEADLAASEAARRNVALSLSYAEVRAPIAGRIGRALVTEGALVGQGEATPLALIQQLDPIYVNMTQSSGDYLQLRQSLATGQVKAPEEAEVALLSQDGKPLPQAGKLLFTDVSVDPNTGTVTLRAQFPNPQRALLPGMFVRARIAQAIDTNAVLIPQQAAQRGAGNDAVFVIADGKVALRDVKIEGTRGNDWIVTAGLKDGEQVIVDRLQQIKPGMAVQGVPWQQPSPAGASGDSPNAAGASQPSEAKK